MYEPVIQSILGTDDVGGRGVDELPAPRERKAKI